MLNHTSDQHAWFQEARSSTDNPRRDWYVWSDTDDRYRGVRIIFIDTELSNWAWDPVSKAYYWHRFFSHQPDLNYDNPAVREEIWKVMKFWLDLGVDGFRVDAVPYLVEREGTSCENLPETHAVLKELRARVDAHFTGKVLLAEANMWPEDVRPYFGDGDEFHMSFHFPIMPRMFMALRLEDRKPLIDIIERTPSIPDSCQWGIFLRNHDELTLEMVTEVERQYMWDEYAKDPRARINLGIRRRLAPLMEGDRRRIELMSGLLMSLPGSPILYYGDEIGMGDNVYLGDRNSVRTPMQWNGGFNAGFSTADPERLWLPLISNAVYGYQAVNVESQQRNPTSLLNWTRRLIEVRRSTRVFGRGSIEFLKPDNHRVLAFTRTLGRETVLVVNNLAGTAQAVELDLSRFAGAIPIEMFGASIFPRIRPRALHHDDGAVQLLLVPAALAVEATGRMATTENRTIAAENTVENGSALSDALLRQLIAVGQVDILVGLPTLNNAATIVDVVRAIHVCFTRDFPAPADGHDQFRRRLDRRHAGADSYRVVHRGGHGPDVALPAHAPSRRRAVSRPAGKAHGAAYRLCRGRAGAGEGGRRHRSQRPGDHRRAGDRADQPDRALRRRSSWRRAIGAILATASSSRSSYARWCAPCTASHSTSRSAPSSRARAVSRRTASSRTSGITRRRRFAIDLWLRTEAVAERFTVGQIWRPATTAAGARTTLREAVHQVVLVARSRAFARTSRSG